MSYRPLIHDIKLKNSSCNSRRGDHHHRHPQYTAGGKGLRLHRLLYLGEIIEFDQTGKVFTHPSQKLTEDYITGRFG
jgi:hypothetical protein